MSAGPVPASRHAAARHSAGVVWRCVTVLFGGYAFAAVAVTLLARLLPIDRAEATGWGMVLSFLVFVSVGLWGLHDHRLGRMSLMIWGGAALGFAALRLLGVRP